MSDACTWREVDEYDWPSWVSDCGERWQFTFDGPKENGVKFCHGCGKPIQIIPIVGDSDE